ncbi:MAG: hypothetical protein IPM34_13115 [Saprospiraceae bacterium]|nr:hypothetical protein [Saprospiraceae bacterium]
MKNKKFKISTFLVFIIFLGTFAQKKEIEIKNGLYVKSKERVTSGITSFSLCEDKLFKKNCKTYTCDDGGQCAQFNLGNNSLKSLLQVKNLNSIKGIQKEKMGLETDYYIQNGNEISYFSMSNNILKIESYTSKPVDPRNKVMAKSANELSEERKKCIKDCVDVALLCKDKCNGNKTCEQECKDSYMACGRNICYKRVPKAIINISINGNGQNKLQLLNQ